MPKFNHLLQLRNNALFSNTMKKLILGEVLEKTNKSFILSSSLILLKYLSTTIPKTQEYKHRVEEIKTLLKNDFKTQRDNPELQEKLNSTINRDAQKQFRADWNHIKEGLRYEKQKLLDIIIDDYTEEKAIRELAYYIVARYSTLYNDHKPLYDFSVNLGYYPISRFIYEHIWGNNSEHISLNHLFSDISISKYEDSDKILTFDQKQSTDSLLDSTAPYKAYIAPTSYGKSEFISQIIKNNNVQNIAIISPTKILVRQNANNIKELLKNNQDLKYKIIYHHDMYEDDTNTENINIVASFTQERGLRFLKEFPEKYFDYIIIDEAHELFGNEGRNHLLEIFKQKNNSRHFSHKHTNQQVLFLSPVVENLATFNNPTLPNDPQVFGQKIKYSLKELDIYYFKENQGYKYNRFLDETYLTKSYSDEFEYIKKLSLNKNLIFITNPRKIELYSQELANQTDSIDNNELNKISEELSAQIHPDFYMVNSIKKGIVYLHGPLPDDIREYIVDKFKQTDISLKYLIANSVVLSGVNFPIDNLFIKNFNAGKNDLINLIGRVNRLKYIFDKNNTDLNKLLSPVHFLDKLRTDKNGTTSYPLKSKMEHLRSLIFEDKVTNDLMKLESQVPTNEKERYQKNNLKKEMILTGVAERIEDEPMTHAYILQLLYMHDLQDLYHSPQNRQTEILQQIQSATKIEGIENIEQRTFDLINHVFFKRYADPSFFGSDFSIRRIKQHEARKYYVGFLKSQKSPFKNRAINLFDYYKRLSVSSSENDYITYIGIALGELSRPSPDYPDPAEVFINLKNKSDIELINIAISKINIEDEYVSFQLNKFFGFLYDVDLLSKVAYNQLIYGSNNAVFITLVKQGLPMNLVHLLDEQDLLTSIKISNYDIKGNNKYTEFYDRQTSDFLKFTLNQYIDKE